MARMPYNEDPRQAEESLRESLEIAVNEKRWQRVQVRLESQPMKRRLYMCCSYSETYKSVARIRLVKIEKT
jgi:hypothetical protein